MDNFEKLNLQLCDNLKKHDKKRFERILDENSHSIDGTFLGFIDIYYHLSKIIPKDWEIVDLGCAFAPQSYYFRNHKKYIAIDSGVKEEQIWKFKNTEFHNCTIREYIKNNKPKLKQFAICSYVPPWGDDNEELTRKNFKHLFVYYPN